MQQPIDEKTKSVLEKIGQNETFKNFYLAGGTALAIHLKHRKSIDLDWFSPSVFSNTDLKKQLSKLGDFVLDNEEEGTINGVLDGVKISFFYYDYNLLFPLVLFKNVNLADERDIASMKIDAMSSRGSKKDFIDLFFILKRHGLKELLEFFEKKYSNIKYNKLHILKSLTYFDDAEDEPMPDMIQEIKWEEMKDFIKSATKGYLER